MEPAQPPKNEPLSWFEFLRLEAELALTFIQSAKLYSNRTDSARALDNARKALAEIRKRLAAKRAKSGLTARIDPYQMKYCFAQINPKRV